MQYEIMGLFRVVDGDNAFSIKAKKVQVLLAVLLVRAGQIVPADQLKEEIWGEHQPRRAAAGIHVYVSQVRKFLQQIDKLECQVQTYQPGYVLRLESDDVDIHRFERLISEGRSYFREHRYDQATTRLEGALALWRGPLLGDIYHNTCHGPILGAVQTWLDETRLECVELLIDSRLRIGHHRELVGNLYQLVQEHPLREALHWQLMLALYRSGRRADALGAYQSARKILDDELGLEPSRDLQDLQRAILDADDQLDLPLEAQTGKLTLAK